MSEFFDEVDEEVRREQLKQLWEKHSILIIAVVVLIIAGVAGWRGYQYLQTQKEAAAGDAFNKALALSDQGKHTEAEAAFAKLVKTAPYGYRVLSRFHAAGEVAVSDPKAAAKMFDEIAADSSVGEKQQALARIRAAGLLLDTASYQEMLQRLEPDTAPTAVFRHSARELLALSAWRANDNAAAQKWLDMMAKDTQTPPGLRSRAQALQALLPPVAKG